MSYVRVVSGVLIASLLASCVAVVVAGAAAGLVVYDRRSVMMMESDARIFHVIQKAVASNSDFHDSRIVVVSYNQVVLLTGQTSVASQRVVLERIAQKAPNVRRVYDEVAVATPISIRQQSKDTIITGEVRSKILTKKGLESGSIRIVTENGVVYLMGIVTAEQGNLAVEVARQVNGVQKVVKVFQYIT